ncbi:MAG: hypothetical protein A2X76_01360 [Lysobacterales bacterium GWF1_69_6]|nr:MAG: hypothetical protein A2X76_01360 [Xanthomonadales bacterium GWF1_69_6]
MIASMTLSNALRLADQAAPDPSEAREALQLLRGALMQAFEDLGSRDFLGLRWPKPQVPAGFDELVACLYDSHTELDFVNNTTGVRASETRPRDVQWPWPWLDGYTPHVSDWRAIGIDVIDMRRPRAVA